VKCVACKDEVEPSYDHLFCERCWGYLLPQQRHEWRNICLRARRETIPATMFEPRVPPSNKTIGKAYDLWKAYVAEVTTSRRQSFTFGFHNVNAGKK
jgi:hypothetical protein